MEEHVHNEIKEEHCGENCSCKKRSSTLIHEEASCSCSSSCNCGGHNHSRDHDHGRHEHHHHAHDHDHHYSHSSCSCGCRHADSGEDRKKTVRKLIISAVLTVIAFVITKLIDLPGIVDFLIFLVPYFFVGFGVLKAAFDGIRRGAVLDENFLMAIATVGAFCIGEFHEAVFVMLFYRVGQMFEELAEEKYPALCGPSLTSKSKPELANKTFATSGILYKAGVKVCIVTVEFRFFPEIPTEKCRVVFFKAEDFAVGTHETMLCFTLTDKFSIPFHLITEL